jgi:3-oxoacyl-[acyl-carrier protein] reductase
VELKLRDKVALVTAAGRGIGRAICLSLATEGARVFATSRTASDLESLLAAMGNDDGRHRSFAMDLAAPGSPEELVEILKASVGLPDIVVHNLGDTLGIKDPLCSMDDWDRVWRVNIGVSLELNRLIIPSMQERRWGRIVNIASTASLENNGPVTYSTCINTSMNDCPSNVSDAPRISLTWCRFSVLIEPSSVRAHSFRWMGGKAGISSQPSEWECGTGVVRYGEHTRRNHPH